MRRMVDMVVGNAPPLAAEADNEIDKEADVADGGVREINARNGNAVVDNEAATWYPSLSPTLPPHNTTFFSRIQVTTSELPRVSLLKTWVSSCSSLCKTTIMMRTSFLARSMACAYPPSNQGRSFTPVDSSNSRMNRAEVSRGEVVRRRGGEVRERVKCRVMGRRKGKRVVKRWKEVVRMR